MEINGLGDLSFDKSSKHAIYDAARFTIEAAGGCTILVTPDGGFVSAKDFDAALAKISELEAENERLKAENERLKSLVCQYQTALAYNNLL